MLIAGEWCPVAMRSTLSTAFAVANLRRRRFVRDKWAGENLVMAERLAALAAKLTLMVGSSSKCESRRAQGVNAHG